MKYLNIIFSYFLGKVVLLVFIIRGSPHFSKGQLKKKHCNPDFGKIRGGGGDVTHSPNLGGGGGGGGVAEEFKTKIPNFCNIYAEIYSKNPNKLNKQVWI